MKKYIISLLSVLVLLAGCSQDNLIPTLNEIKVSSSYIVLAADGDEKEFVLNTTGDWTITSIPEDGYSSSAWLTVEPTSGPVAKDVKIKLSAFKAYEDLTAELHINVGGATQVITVKQSLGNKLDITSVDDFMNKGVDGKTYTVQGIVGSVENTVYGNFYLNDGTYTDGKEPGLYVYGMLDANGAEKNFLSLGIEEGDEVIISGPRKTYSPKIEIEKATLVKMVKKALLGATVKAYVQSNEAGTLKAPVVVKGDNAQVSVPGDVDWIKFLGVEGSGENSKILLSYTENKTAAPRDAEITVISTRTYKDKDGEEKTDRSELIIGIKQLPALSAAKKISEINFKNEDYVTIEGEIAALATNGFILYDGNTTADAVNKVFVEVTDFDSSKYKVGYKINVSGSAQKKYARNKVVADIFTVAGEAEGYNHPEPVALNSTNAESVMGESPAKYGYYEVSGFVDSKNKINIPGTKVGVTAISPIRNVDLKGFVGNYVTVKGYYTDNNSKYSELQFVLTDVKKGEGAPSMLKLQSTSAKIGWNEPSASLYIIANQNWTASIDGNPEGVSLSKMSGEKSGEVKVTFAAKNDTYNEEKIKVNVTDGAETLTFTVTRAGKELNFSQRDMEISSKEQEVRLTVNASMFWKASISTGAELNKVEGKGTDELIVSVPANTTGQTKTYTVTLSDDRVVENKIVTLTITQKAPETE